MQGISREVRAIAATASGTALLVGTWGLLTALAQGAAWELGARTAFIAPSFAGPAGMIAFAVAVLGMGELLAYIESDLRLREIPRSVARSLRRIALVLFRALGIARFRRRDLVLAAMATTLALALNIVMAMLEGTPRAPDDPRYLATATLNPLEQGLVFALVGAPEELLLRGPVLIALALSARMASRWWRSSTVLAVLIATSAIFGALHPGGPGDMLSAGVSGLIWGALSLATRSIWPAAISHATHNLIVGLVT